MGKKFVSTSEALSQLPFDITRQALYQLIKAGELIEGTHYIDIRSPGGVRATYRIDPNAVADYFTNVNR